MDLLLFSIQSFTFSNEETYEDTHSAIAVMSAYNNSCINNVVSPKLFYTSSKYTINHTTQMLLYPNTHMDVQAANRLDLSILPEEEIPNINKN